MEKPASFQYVAAVAQWLTELWTEGHAHGALLVQAMVDQGMGKDQLGAVDKALGWMARAGWIQGGSRRPLPIRMDLGEHNPDGLWTYDWMMPWGTPATAQVREFIDAIQGALPPPAASEEFQDILALSHFDRAARRLRVDASMGQTPDTTALVAAAKGWADRVVKARGRTRQGKDLDMGANLDPAQAPGKAGGK